VLRFCEDLTEARDRARAETRTADATGRAVGTVKSQVPAGPGELRAAVGFRTDDGTGLVSLLTCQIATTCHVAVADLGAPGRRDRAGRTNGADRTGHVRSRGGSSHFG
jgi:hypothetical protein